MGANSKIEWTHHTFSPWLGCQVVSPACDRCYAKAFAKRVGFTGKERPSGKPILPLLWGGASTARHVVGETTWRAPLKWNASAAARGVRERVFCASMSDVFEDRAELVAPRARLHRLIVETQALDWLLLTKRPQNADRLMSQAGLLAWDGGGPDAPTWPANVWLGTTVEDQRYANERIPELLRVPARVRFLSCEPLLESIDLNVAAYGQGHELQPLDIQACQIGPGWKAGFHPLKAIDWVICGGETGSGARPMHPAWARSIRDQCVAAGVAFHFKQHGDWAPIERSDDVTSKLDAKRERWMNLAGGHGFHGEDVWRMRRVGKKRAGRILDGRTWDEFPEVA